MKRKVAIYLAGSIQKGHENHKSFWTNDDMSIIKACLSDFDVSFLNPAFRTDDLSDAISVFGRDMMQVYCSDVVFVDARDQRGLGVGAEMMWAKGNKIPVISWSPKNTHYYKINASVLGVDVKEYIHPFVAGLSDRIVETLEEGAEWIKRLKSDDSSVKVKDFEDIVNSMRHYKATQFHSDKPMQELFKVHEELHLRVKL